MYKNRETWTLPILYDFSVTLKDILHFLISNIKVLSCSISTSRFLIFPFFWSWPKIISAQYQSSSSFLILWINSAEVILFNDEHILSWLYPIRQHSSFSRASTRDKNRWIFRHSSRRLPLDDSINVLSVGFPGRERSIIPPCSYTNCSRLFEINSLPLSLWIRTDRRLT